MAYEIPIGSCLFLYISLHDLWFGFVLYKTYEKLLQTDSKFNIQGTNAYSMQNS